MKFFRTSGFVVVSLTVFLCGTHTTFAASTIGTDISTGGTLSVTGLSSLSGGASTTQLSALSRIYIGSSGTTTILGDSSTSTFSGGISASGGGLHLTNGGIRVNSLNTSNCDLKSDTSGLFYCGTDAGGSVEVNWTYFNGSGVRTSTTTSQVLIGATATTSAQKLEVQGGVYISGNLGLGTTSPYAKLSVVGEVLASYFTATSTATSTFKGLRADCFSYDGITCLVTGGGGSGTVNSGTGGYAAYYASTGTAISGTSTLFLAPNGRIGIGTTTPSATFSVNGTTLLGGTLAVTGAANIANSLTVTGNTTLLGALQLDGSTTTTNGFGINLQSGGCFAIAGTCISTATSSVSSVSNVNGSLTITPTSGAVVASLNLANSNTWTASQTFGALTLLNGNASTSQLTASSRIYVGSSSATTIEGNLATSTFSGGINLSSGCFAVGGTCIGSSTGANLGAANTWTAAQTFSANTVFGGNATVTASTGGLVTNGTISAANITTTGNVSATTGTLTLANSSTAISGIVFGTCSWAATSTTMNMTASSSAFVDCGNATGITTLHKVFIQATSSLPASILVHSASSSGANMINIQLVNLSASAVNFGSFTLNFFGIR